MHSTSDQPSENGAQKGRQTVVCRPDGPIHDGADILSPATEAQQPQAANPTQEMAQVDIPYHKTVLENGLTVLVHEDRKTPIVNVTVWYHVGSKNEVAGKTGFAHLFEHLMFGGSENVENFDIPLESAGSTSTNGSTWFDRTN